MELTKQQKQHQELLQKIISKAWEDESFKHELMVNPVTAIKKATNGELTVPEGKTLVVRDQTDASAVYINIPAKPNLEDVELSEQQLEAVAGGSDEHNGFTWKEFVYIMTHGWG